jgi:hypothetical protein
LKEDADFIKIYETGADSLHDGHFSTPYQYSELELKSAVQEAARLGKHVAVHAMGDDAANAGKADFRGTNVYDLGVFCRSRGHTRARRARTPDARLCKQRWSCESEFPSDVRGAGTRAEQDRIDFFTFNLSAIRVCIIAQTFCDGHCDDG